MRCSESDNDFEDAVESLDVFPVDQPCVNIVNKETGTGSRRKRLANLRSRIKSEFGLAAGGNLGSQNSFDDISQSDCTSIASWGQRLLNEANQSDQPIHVIPPDTLSTKAPYNEHVSSPAPDCPPPPLPFAPPMRAIPPPLPPRRFSPPVQMPPEVVTKTDIVTEVLETPKRSHTKSKSLDRGMSLVDCKVPLPTSAKSSSLNRGVSGKIVNGLCEEEQRINNAQGVIHQITLSVLSSSRESISGSNTNSSTGSLPFQSYKTAREQSFTPERITSTIFPRPNNVLPVVGEESTISVSPTCPSSLNSPTVDHPDNHIDVKPAFAGHKRYASVDQQPQKHTIAPFKECRSVSELYSHPEHEEHRRPPLCHMASIDPITRDVERRMSMKDHHSTMSSSNSGEASREQSLPSIHSGVGYARNLVKNYGNIAQVFFKGAYQKARNIVVQKPRTVAIEREDDEVSESDAASSSVSMSTSEHNIRTSGKADGPGVICRPRSIKKGPYDFGQLRVVQELNNEHTGAVWSLKFSMCGRLLATAGQDNLVRIWVLSNYLSYFTRVREKYNPASSESDIAHEYEKIHLQMDKKPYTQFEDDDSSLSSRKSPLDSSASTRSCSTQAHSQQTGSFSNVPVFASKPFCVYRGHTADILDLAWSPRNYFLLSSSMDNTVKLWHLTRSECLCCFQHTDFVTCIAFMPKDDRYFISGSMDGKIRLWHIPEKKVALWNEVDQVKFITAIAFIRNRFVVVGTYDGRCFFYTTDQLKYHTVINVRSSRGKNARGHKITSLAVHGNQLLVTSNDSRIRMYSIDNIELISKFKGAQIERSQIRASFSPDGKYVICGSEDCYAYIWRVNESPTTYSVHNNSWERIRVHNIVVTAAVFAPKPSLVFQLLIDNKKQLSPVKLNASRSKRSELNSPTSNNNNTTMESRPSSSIGFLANTAARASRVFNDFRHSKPLNGRDLSNKPAKKLEYAGDVVVTADLNGSIKVMANPRDLFPSQTSANSSAP